MSAVDWADLERDWEVVAEVVSQHDCDSVIGRLEGLDLSGCSVTEGYYSDTRVSATVSTVVGEGETDGYVDLARIRLVLRVPRWGWERELVTGFVTSVVPTVERGLVRREYSLDSSLWAISEDALTSRVTCTAGASALSCATKLLGDRRMEHDAVGAQDRTVAKVTVWEAGTMLLHMLFELMDDASRLDVDGHGPITLRRYVAPSRRTPEVEIDPWSPRSVVVGEVSEEDGSWERPGAAIVTATVTKTSTSGGKTTSTQEVRAGSYLAPSTDRSSRDRRGYLRFESGSYQGDADEPTQAQLEAEARKVWDGASEASRTWELTTLYMDLHEGDMVTLRLPDGPHRCLCQTVETDLGERTQRLTLKEV